MRVPLTVASRILVGALNSPLDPMEEVNPDIIRSMFRGFLSGFNNELSFAVAEDVPVFTLRC